MTFPDKMAAAREDVASSNNSDTNKGPTTVTEHLYKVLVIGEFGVGM